MAALISAKYLRCWGTDRGLPLRSGVSSHPQWGQQSICLAIGMVPISRQLMQLQAAQAIHRHRGRYREQHREQHRVAFA